MTAPAFPIDPRAIGVTHAVTTLLLSVLLALVAYRARHTAGSDGIRAWAAGGFCAGVGLLLSMGQYDVSPWVSFVVGNTLCTLSLSLVLFGVQRFKGAPGTAWIAWLPALGVAAFCVYFGVVAPSVRARIVGVGLVMAILALVTCRELLRPPRDVLRIPFWFTAFVGLVFALILIARSIAALLEPPVKSSVEPTFINAIAYFTGGFGMLSLIVGLILAINYSMLADAQRLAGRDVLTGCLNRHGFREAVGERLETAADGSLLAVALDLDHFKTVNDDHGHETGDRLLHAFAECVQAEIEIGTLFARLGGEEFCLILPARFRRHPQELVEAIRARFEREGAARAGLRRAVTVSAGIAEGAADEDGLRAAMKAADEALYEAKRTGRNRIVVAAQESHPAQEKSHR